MANPAVYETDLPGKISRGKVRDIYQVDHQLMIVASDRISAFDVVMGQPVPGKGAILTRMSRFWLETLPACRPHHLEYVVSDQHCPPQYRQWLPDLRERAMVVKRVAILPIECIVRGYIVGSGWKEYQAHGTVSGLRLPPGLRRADKLPQPIFTPSTKATVGHDEAVSYEGACGLVAEFLDRRKAAACDAEALVAEVRRRSLAIYREAAALAEQRGIILADTKFEFGLAGDELLLADEVLTPDSSRFWPADKWQPGQDPPSFDKQYLRDYLESLPWNKQPPPPPLPAEVLARTAERYETAFRLLTGA